MRMQDRVQHFTRTTDPQAATSGERARSTWVEKNEPKPQVFMNTGVPRVGRIIGIPDSP